MKSRLVAILSAIIVILGLGASVCAAEQFSAKPFAGPDGKLDRQQRAFYIVHRDKEPLSKFMTPGQTTLDPQKVVDAMARKNPDRPTIQDPPRGALDLAGTGCASTASGRPAMEADRWPNNEKDIRPRQYNEKFGPCSSCGKVQHS